MPSVLLIEDDAGVRDGLRLALRHQGYDVTVAEDGETGLRIVRVQPPDVIILDIMLPGLDGFEVCRRLRSMGNIPIIMLTARGDDFDVVGGLEAGADDYVVKPVQPRVLDARIRTVLRRLRREPDTRHRYGDLLIDRAGLTVTKGGRPVSLTATEIKLLMVLSAAAGQVFSRGQILQRVWEQDFLGDSRLVDSCVQRIRAKIEDDTAAPIYLQTVRGFGYRFGPV